MRVQELAEHLGCHENTVFSMLRRQDSRVQRDIKRPGDHPRATYVIVDDAWLSGEEPAPAVNRQADLVSVLRDQLAAAQAREERLLTLLEAALAREP